MALRPKVVDVATPPHPQTAKLIRFAKKRFRKTLDAHTTFKTLIRNANKLGRFGWKGGGACIICDVALK